MEAMLPAMQCICVAGMVFGIIMVAIWICIGIMGGPGAYLPRPPELKAEYKCRNFGGAAYSRPPAIKLRKES